ncbi:MAG: NUDIX domain-containing protein [Planctomycetaceae bacterium]
MDIAIAETFQYCPMCAAAAEIHGENPFRCQACGHVHHFGPVTAVAAIVADSVGQILLLKRARDPGQGKWGLPGGFVDANETAESALIREVREEVNLELVQMRYLYSFPNSYLYRGVTIPVTDLFYFGRIASFEEMTAQPGEIESWHFCHPTETELAQMAFPSNRSALELFLANVD